MLGVTLTGQKASLRPDDSEQGIEDWFRRYGTIVYRRALVLLGNPAEAEDAVQEVFIKAMGSLGDFRNDSKVSTWLYKIATNYCLSQMRNSSRRRELREQHLVPAELLVCHRDPAAIQSLRALLQRAPEDQAMCAVYIYLDGMTRPEAAETLGVSLRTVGNLLQKFGVWARQELEDNDPGRALFEPDEVEVHDSSNPRVQ